MSLGIVMANLEMYKLILTLERKEKNAIDLSSLDS